MRKIKFLVIFVTLAIFAGIFAFSADAYSPHIEPIISPINAPGGTITPEGTATVVDRLSNEDGTLFYTIQTSDEHVFHLIIDTYRGGNNVYFLNAVTVDDLIPLAQNPGAANVLPPSVSPLPPSEQDGADSDATPNEQNGDALTPTPPPAQDRVGSSLVWMIVVIVVVGGAGYYFKIYRPKKQAELDGSDDDSDYDGEDDGDYDESETEEDYDDSEDEDDSAHYT